MVAVLCGGELLVHGSQKKLDFLQPSADASAAPGQAVRMRLLPREKGDASVPANRAALDAMVAAVVAAGKRLALFPSDPLDGAVAQGWRTEVDAAGVTLEDGLKGAESYLALKDEEALAEMKAAGKLAARVLRQVALADMEGYINDDKKVSNAALAAGVSATVEDRAKLEKRKVPVDTDSYDQALPLLVQSGGQYTIAVTAPKDGEPPKSTDRPLSYDVILMSLAMRYKGMRAVCARTYLIDPTPKMKKVYEAIEAAQAGLIALLVPGAVIKDACATIRDVLIASGIPLEAALSKNFGSGVGARLSDRHLVLSVKNATVVEPGMCFNVSVCLSDIPLEDRHAVAEAPVNKLKSYAIVLADTVIVSAAGAPPLVVTDKAPRALKEVSYEMASEEDEEDEEDEEGGGDDDEEADEERRDRSKKKAASGSKRPKDFDPSAGRDETGRSARLREKAKEVDPKAAEKREAHQQELAEKRKAEALKKRAGGQGAGAGAGAGGDSDEEIENAPDIVGYRSTSDYPKGTRPNQIVVDKARDCVLLPMLGTLVPFHISTIKNCSKSEEGYKSLLRINFYSAGAALGKDTAPSMRAAALRHPQALFIRTLNFMSRDGRNFVDVDQKIKAMLKQHRTQRKEEKETGGLVEQPRLVLRREGTVPKVVDIHMWPSIGGRGKTQGTLAAHMNGLLFQSNKGENLEIIYANIKAAIFQPCEGEHVVLMHFHLKHSILIGKKKFRELQFYTEVVEQSQALDARGGSAYDQDELQEEEREAKLKARLNKAYKYFVTKIEDAVADSHVNFRAFEVPSRDLSFTGSWSKEMRTILLGASSIISVIDRPPLVVPIEDIEFVHFERVLQGGKSFDMVVVLKAGVTDKGQDEFVSITQIEMKHMETISTWLDEVAEVIITQSAESLTWKAIIAEEVRRPDFWLDEDSEGNPKNQGMMEVLHPFAEMGGAAEAEGEEEDGEEDEDEEAYEEEEEEEDEDSESDYDDEDGDSDDDEDDDDEEEEGDDSDAASWSVLEQKVGRARAARPRHGRWCERAARFAQAHNDPNAARASLPLFPHQAAAADKKKKLRDGGTDDEEEERKKKKPKKK